MARRRTVRALALGAVVIALAGAGLVGTPALAATTGLLITKAIPAQTAPAGGILLETTFTANQPAAGGSVILSGSADGATPLLVDDLLEIRVTRADGSVRSDSTRFNPVCAAPNEAGFIDISSLLGPGANKVTLDFKDLCGGTVSTSPVFVNGSGTYALVGPTPTSSVKVASAASLSPVPASGVLLKTTFTATQPEQDGRAWLTGSADGTVPLLVDDQVDLEITHADGSRATASHRFNPVCAAANEASHIDLASLLQPGRNVVTVTVRDVCGGAVSTQDMYAWGNGTYSNDLTSPPTSPPTSPDTSACQRNPVPCYAPQVRFDSYEANLPMGTDEFIAHSSLRWAHDGGCADHQIVALGKIDAAALGAGTYTHQQERYGCFHSGKFYSSAELTRPSTSSSQKNGLASTAGFYLDLDNTSRAGDPLTNGKVTAPITYSYVPGKYVIYWFMYGFNRGATASVGVDRHEGEWERILVRLNPDNTPKSVGFFQHTCGAKYFTWAQMTDRDATNGSVVENSTHPIVYSSAGSHASYPAAFAQPLSRGICQILQGIGDRAPGNGATWDTWTVTMTKDSQEPWYCFGGAWGEVGSIAISIGGDRRKLAFNTGPLGPPWSNPEDKSKSCARTG